MRWLWGLLGVLLSPILALAVALHPRLRRGWRSRLGFPVLRVEPGAVWLHAASLGEGALAAAFAAAVRAARPELPLLRTWTSDAAAGQRVGGDAPWDQDLAAPLDSPLFVGPWLDRVRPRLLVLVEAELWPWALGACRARGIPVVVVAARLGPGQRRLLAHPRLWRSLGAGLRWFVPDAATAALVGGEVVGELRAEVPRPPAALTWEGAAVVAGSTWEGEEAALLAAWEALPAPRPPLVLAPRDPRRFEAVAAWLGGRWPRHRRRSRLGEAAATTNDGAVLRPDEVLLLDSLGELAGLYRPGVVAFVGGTFQAAVGGHGPVEPAAAGAVLLAGPERHANPAAWAGRPVVHAADPGEALRVALGVALDRARGALGPAVGQRASGAARSGSSSSEEGAASAPPGAGAPGPVARALVEALATELDGPVPAERPLRPWLAPLALGWAAGVALRAALTRPRRAPVPVISVGGITAGGSGKSPVALAILGIVEEHAPAVLVARGYRRGPGPAVRLGGPALGAAPPLGGAPTAAALGDELAQAARRGHRVASAPDRLAGITAAVACWGPVVAVLDDGFQHRRLARDLDVVVLDARHPTGGGLLPVGLGREGLGALSRADLVVSMHGPLPPAVRAQLPAALPVVEAHLRPSGWRHRGERHPPEALAGREVHVLVGVARPEGFLAALRRLGCRPATVEIHADHAPFDAATLGRLAALPAHLPLVTTEKDAARLPPGLEPWVLEVEVAWGEGAERLRERIAAVLAPLAVAPAEGA